MMGGHLKMEVTEHFILAPMAKEFNDIRIDLGDKENSVSNGME